jgi:sugar phosphate isomerase/epimerase
MVNTLAQAAELATATGLDSVGVCADTFHMSIEEASVEGSVRASAGRIGHVQVSDTNRLEPGAGHLDWPALLATLGEVGYAGPLAFECRLSGPPEVALPRAVAVLRAAGA